MIVIDLNGNSEAVTDYKDLTIKRKVNGEYSLAFRVFSTERNKHSYPLVVEESIIEYEDQQYRIKNVEERFSVKFIQAQHIFFDVIDEYVYNVMVPNQYTIKQVIDHALFNTSWTVEVKGNFPHKYFEKFGDDNALSLIQIALNEFGAEFDIEGSKIILYNQIGSETDYQMRYKHNTKSISKSVNTTNLSTYAKGYANRDDYGNYLIQTEYTSPLAAVYGKRHAKPLFSDTITSVEEMKEYIKVNLNDTPEVSIEIEFVELKGAGYEGAAVNLGDTVFIIYEPLNIDISARIVEIETYPESKRSPKVMIANFKKSVIDILADFRQKQDSLDKTVVKKSAIYNGVSITEENGVRVSAQNGVVTTLNATEGIDIKRNGQQVFYADTQGNLNLTGTITASSFIGGSIIGSTIATTEDYLSGKITLIGSVLTSTKYGSAGQEFVRLDNGSLQVQTKSPTTGTYQNVKIDGNYGLNISSSINWNSKLRIDVYETYSSWNATHYRIKAENPDGRASLYIEATDYINIQAPYVQLNGDWIATWSDLDDYALEGHSHTSINTGYLVLSGGTLQAPYGTLWIGQNTVKAETITELSNAELKKNISQWEGNALELICSTPVRQFQYKNELDEEFPHIGIIVQESPVEVIDLTGIGVDIGAKSTLLWKAVQELKAEIDLLKGA